MGDQADRQGNSAAGDHHAETDPAAAHADPGPTGRGIRPPLVPGGSAAQHARRRRHECQRRSRPHPAGRDRLRRAEAAGGRGDHQPVDHRGDQDGHRLLVAALRQEPAARAVEASSTAIASVSSNGGRVSVTPPISTGIRFAAANATTPPCSATPTSAPDDGVTAHSTMASPAARISPEAATAAPRTAAAAATSPVGLGASGGVLHRSGAFGSQLADHLATVTRGSTGCRPGTPPEASRRSVTHRRGGDRTGDDLRSGRPPRVGSGHSATGPASSAVPDRQRADRRCRRGVGAGGHRVPLGDR